MEGLGKKKPRPRRSFTPQFKADIAARCDSTCAETLRPAFHDHYVLSP